MEHCLMPVSIRGTAGGSVTLSSGAAATDTTLTLPNTTGTVALTASPTFSGTTTVTTLTATTITSPSATALTFQYGGTTGATLDTSGNLLVGTTSMLNSGNTMSVLLKTGNSTGTTWKSPDATGGAAPGYLNFFNSSGTQVGYIAASGTATTYATSSDYRLKENFVPMDSGLVTVNALKPVNFVWINEQLPGEGFIAHELAEVVPLAVNGEKDAVNEDGSIKPQGVDYSKIVVHLVAATQELSAKNDALEARLAALEAK
jgi:hypothetical protein